MTKNTILGIFLAGIMLCGSIPLGFSEPVLQQWKNTNDINEVSCDNENHVLVMRDNGNPVCVTEKSAMKLGWEIVENHVTPQKIVYDYPLSSKTFDNESKSEPKGWGDNFDVTISNIPEIGETAVITVTITNTEEFDLKVNLPDEYISIDITDNFEFVDVSGDKIIIDHDGRYIYYNEKLDLDAGETKTLSATIKAVKAGLGHAGGDAGDWGFNYWMYVDAEQTLLREDYEQLHPQAPSQNTIPICENNEPCPEPEPEPPTPGEEEISTTDSVETPQKIVYDYPLSSKDYQRDGNYAQSGTLGDFELTLSSLPKVGETVDATATFTRDFSDEVDFGDYELYLSLKINNDILEFVEIIPSGLEVKNNEKYNMKGVLLPLTLSDGETVKISATIKVLKEGIAKISSSMKDDGGVFWFYTSENESLLMEDYYTKYPSLESATFQNVDDEPEPPAPTEEESEIAQREAEFRKTPEGIAFAYDKDGNVKEQTETESVEQSLTLERDSHYIPDLADFIKKYYSDVDVREFLRESNATEAFIERFFELNPDLRNDLKTQSLIKNSIQPNIIKEQNDNTIKDVKVKDVTFDYVVDPTENPDEFAQKMIDFFDDELVEIKRGDYNSGYLTKKGHIKIYDEPNFTAFGEGSTAVFKYTFFGIDRIHPREAETVTYALLDELGITLDGTENFKECVVCDNYDYYFEQTLDGWPIESNVIVTDFEPGYTFIYIGTWNDSFPDVEFYDVDKAREIAKDYVLTIPELTGQECEIAFHNRETDTSVSLNMVDGRPVYGFDGGTCQVELWAGHHAYYYVYADALTGESLFVRAGWVF